MKQTQCRQKKEQVAQTKHQGKNRTGMKSNNFGEAIIIAGHKSTMLR